MNGYLGSGFSGSLMFEVALVVQAWRLWSIHGLHCVFAVVLCLMCSLFAVFQYLISLEIDLHLNTTIASLFDFVVLIPATLDTMTLPCISCSSWCFHKIVVLPISTHLIQLVSQRYCCWSCLFLYQSLDCFVGLVLSSTPPPACVGYGFLSMELPKI